jgi:hypothetical protein
MQSVVPTKLTVSEFAQQIRGQMVPLGSRFSYFSTGVPIGEDDVKEYLEDPMRALPAGIRGILPETAIILVPFLEQGEPSREPEIPTEALICFDEPEKDRRLGSARTTTAEGAVLVFALRGQDVAEYHYRLYHCLAGLVADIAGDDIVDEFNGIIRDELSAGVHGEVDEESWELKRDLIRRQRNLRRKTKGFEKYARQSLIDTLTLYMHGICCDIDVETGPRQLASRHLRRRLEFFQSLYPAPEGFAVFPEDLNHSDERPTR